MGDEEVALLRLWREKRGEAEPEDLTSSLEILLESVRRLQAGLHSFLSMRRIEARRKNANAFRLRHSQSFEIGRAHV